MALWIATLRMTGLSLFGLTTVGAFLLVSSLPTRSLADNFAYGLMLTGTVALALLSISVAAGLHTLRDIDQRTRRHNAALRALLPKQHQQYQPPPDLAPHAPTNWREFKPRPLDPAREKDEGYEQRMARRGRYTHKVVDDGLEYETRPNVVSDPRYTRITPKPASVRKPPGE